MYSNSQTTSFQYDILPTFPVQGKLSNSYQELVAHLIQHNIHCIDGFVGVNWKLPLSQIEQEFVNQGIKVKLISMETALLPEAIIQEKVAPYLGGKDPLFGKKASLHLSELFDQKKLAHLQEIVRASTNGEYIIFYGIGAALLEGAHPVMYIDLPKNVLIQRMRAGQAWNLGCSVPTDQKETYKRYYFVDWEILNRHKRSILPRIEIIADQQSATELPWMVGQDLQATLSRMSENYFRVRPTFEPGVWGGQWMKEHLIGIDQQPKNYAWSFEMIVPENGILLEDNGLVLEISFDLLMYQESLNVLGKAQQRFDVEFPIRFNFLDTFDGGNLSIQCHPSPAYAKAEFGENFTQDESYYIVDRKEDAQVYLGFQEDIKADDFRAALEQSFHTGIALNIEKYVQKFESQKHQLYLIPHGTVHSSGVNNLVLEISATPYNYTFKMYDWVRPDLDGKPRPLNIERAFSNLNFTRKGDVVKRTLISQPADHELDVQSKKVHLPTHEDHFYAVCRYEFEDGVNIETKGQCHIMMLVEGEAIALTTANGMEKVFHYAETFAVPAAANSYSLRNLGTGTVKVIQSFVKDAKC
ncbi:class I mannose-6-phosphate isomerase [Sphingobacterium sp. N143]|uniref:class I mannose-6-phosphate isomerase n=1 Tax=Sphingobacterium sp. N143 TaxID=2746727 RepID=UPI0025784B7D|nr:class I mannose-6-phosphate isomerase [Sphingobacterium sp. N143]MDM1293045.1 class I mannose-6-phosphate isomerase [Sphingobacterium sp. N143]